ncbi:MAG: ArsA family ATPase [Acidobacteria bacterium]|nr:ArsA family ATPase [Acidobacteriota bacterium]
MTPPPRAAALEPLLERRIVFVGGKGGVGKTTIAAALAVAAADRGRRCLVVSTDPAHSLGDVFDRAVGDTETLLADRLWGLEIDPDAAAGRHITAVKAQMKRLVHPRMYAEVDRQLELARLAPGTVEAALLERVAELMVQAGGRFDLVIFDTAPTGHTLRLLSLPEIMATWVEGLLRHRERSSRLASVLARLGRRPADLGEQSPSDDRPPHEDEARAAALTEMLAARQRKFRRARELLLDREATAFVLVLNPDKLSILESQKTLQSLGRVHVPVAALVVNRVLPEGAGGAFLEARRRQEGAYLIEIEEAFAPFPRVSLPLWPEDVRGLSALGRLGRYLSEATG